jgi:hypothetical protein
MGQSILTVSSLVALLASTRIVRTKKPFPVFMVVLAVLNLHTFDLLIRGQVDAFILLGIALGWWSVRNKQPWGLSLAFWLMGIKPLNVILPALLYLFAIRKWSRLHQFQAISLTAFSVLLSFVLIGVDWPLRYIHNYQVYSPPKAYLTLTLWRVAKLLDLPSWPFMVLGLVCVIAFLRLTLRTGLNEWTLSVALATNLVFAQVRDRQPLRLPHSRISIYWPRKLETGNSGVFNHLDPAFTDAVGIRHFPHRYGVSRRYSGVRLVFEQPAKPDA